MNLEQYLNHFAKEENMETSPEAREKMIEAITDYVTEIVEKTISLKMHKTLMLDDVDMAMTLLKWEHREEWYEDGRKQLEKVTCTS